MPDRYEQQHSFAVHTISPDGSQLTLDTRNKKTVTYSAFKVDLAKDGIRHASVARWNMTLPGQHILWERYCVAACHLRSMDGVPAAKIEVANATHELQVMAINPDFPQSAFENGGIDPLTPINYAMQFACDSDERCAWLIEQLAKFCVEYRLIAEIQGIIGAKELWDNTITRLLAGQAAFQ